MKSPALLLLALLLCAAAPARAPGEADDPRIAEVLHRRKPDTRSRTELAAELARLGPGLIPVWRRWLVGAGVEAVLLADGDFRPDEWMVTPEAVGDLAFETLLALPQAAVLDDLEHGIRRDGPGPSEYLAAFRVLEGLGSARGLPLFWLMVERLDLDVALLPRYRSAADAALAAMLARDKEVWMPLEKRLARPNDLEVELFLTAAHQAGQPEAYELVQKLLDGDGAFSRLEALRTLARLEREYPWRCGSELVERVEREWPDLAPAEQLEAIALLGSSEDPHALAPLRRLLGSPDPLLALNAPRALAELGRVDFGSDAEAWQLWEERELAWREEDFEGVVENLQLGTSTAAANFVALASHPLHRREIARAVGARLHELEPAVQALGGSFLLGLRTRAALPALARLLKQGEDPELRERLQAGLLELGVPVMRASLGGALAPYEAQ